MAMFVGFHRFHPDVNLSFQLNRLCADGSREMVAEVTSLGPRIHDFQDWVREMLALADGAERAGRLADAARYVRAAEFFLDPGDARKRPAYERFVALFERAAAGRFERHSVPYPEAPLPALRLATPTPESKGVLVVHGGFDSFIEEFFPFLDAARARGFTVIGFEGPGQGSLLVRKRMPMTHEWERPTTAVLEYFGFSQVTLIGISLGGYLALRAAAFERRIARVVAWDVLYDMFECLLFASHSPALLGGLVKRRLICDRVIDGALRSRMRRDALTRWGVAQGMQVMGVDSPSAFLRHVMRYRTAPFSASVSQHVLLLAGAEDHYVPVHQLDLQAAALVNARSVTRRLFTAEEQAASHCQIGNLPLVMETIGSWVEAHTTSSE